MRARLMNSAAWASAAIGVLTAAAPAAAQTDGSSLAEVVVTARRIDERLQDVPISITVYNQEQIAQRNIVTPTDLATYTPSLTTNQRFGAEKSSFVIRGFTQESGTSPSVGVYFADVVVPRAQAGTTSGNTALPGAFFDLQNVQVLKGPQGTLFGRNTTGGAVLMIPQKPTREFEGYVEGSLGNFDMWRTQGVLNLPLADTLRLRVGFDRMEREGYVENHSGVGPKDYNDVNYYAGRLSLVADLTENLENYTIFSVNHTWGHGYASHIALCRPSGGSGAAAILGPLACAQIARQDARGDDILDVEVNNPKPQVAIRQAQVINTTTWRATDNLTIKNIVSYAQYRERDSFSLNGENFTVPPAAAGRPANPFTGQPFNYILVGPAPQGDNAAQSTLTEELQFQGRTSDDRLNWQAGAYLEISEPLGWSQGYTSILLACTDPRSLQCVNPIGGGTISAARTKTVFNNKGFYAQGTYKLTDVLSVTGGIRYTIDKTRGINESTRIAFLPGAGGPGAQTCNDTVRFKGPGGVGGKVVASTQECRFAIETKSEKPTWLIGLDYKPSTDLLIYGKWARGYRQGGVNMSNVGLETWDPEEVDTYEVGLKTSFNTPVPTRLNISAFYNDFREQQITGALIAKPGAGIAGGAAIVNAGKSKLWGVEFDGQIQPFEGFTLDVGYAYLNTELEELDVPTLPADSPFQQVIPTALVGAPLSFAPKNRVTATATYKLPLSEDIGDISIGATFVHTDEQNATSPSASPLYRLPSTDLLNLNFDWKNVMQQPIDISVFATNVTDEIYPVAVGSSYTSAGFESVLGGPPRMYGVRVRYRFGG